MCGICGVFCTNERERPDTDGLMRMSRQIVHRGPDDDGVFVHRNVALAMRRLSIIDVAGGHQPIANEDETLRIVYNGEIYNHLELRRDLERKGHKYRTTSDTETIVHLYEEYGEQCVNLLRGMFAFAIWDRRRGRLFAARDRLGIKPFYYRFSDGTFVFASEIKAILAYPGVRARLDESKLGEYLAFGYLSGDGTMFSGIRRLLPGHTLEVAEGTDPIVRRYWDLPAVAADNRPYKFYVDTYRELLEQCVSSHLMSDVPLGVFLSGGLDSSAVAALTTKIRGEPIQTFSVGYDEEAYSELPYASEVARHIGSQHHEARVGRRAFFEALPKLVWHEDEPIAWPSSVPLYFVARLAREHVTVVLTGEGSDETLAGYDRYAWTLLNARFDPLYRSLTPAGMRRWIRDKINTSAVLPARAARRLRHTFLGRDGTSWASLYFDNFYSAFAANDLDALISSTVRDKVADPYAAALSYANGFEGDLVHNMLYTDIHTYLQELLMKQDQMSMAASIESRVPFLDHVLVEFAMGVPGEFLIKGLSGKHVLKSAIADLLPSSIIYRKKMGFPTPWARWLSGPQLDNIQAMLSDERARRRGLFREGAVTQCFEEHRRGFRDRGTHIWRLLNLEIWQRIFIDNEPPDHVAAAAESVSSGVLG
jgi:asparagine synthase (glutamine-hydrolysing)